MKTIQENAEEYGFMVANGTGEIGFKYIAEKAFISGVEFAQRWIPVEEDLPPLGQLLQVKGIPDKNNIEYDYATFEFKKGLCNSHLILATHWRPIDLK